MRPIANPLDRTPRISTLDAPSYDDNQAHAAFRRAGYAPHLTVDEEQKAMRLPQTVGDAFLEGSPVALAELTKNLLKVFQSDEPGLAELKKLLETASAQELLKRLAPQSEGPPGQSKADPGFEMPGSEKPRYPAPTTDAKDRPTIGDLFFD